MNDYIARLRARYDEHFGCAPAMTLDCRGFWKHCAAVPDMAVFAYRLENSRRAHHVAITAGMSQRPMHFAPYMGKARWSTELICYLDHLGGEDLRHLQWLAGMPFHDQLALGRGHSVAFGFPLYEYSLLRHFLLLGTPDREDAGLFDGFADSAYPVDLLWVVPLTEPEYQVKVKRNLEGIGALLSQSAHPLSLDRHRHCYVTGERPEGLGRVLH
ncbi:MULTISPECIES: suppressor of fused domain protein [Pseudomonas aeruginosa group]|uniref:Suppressor of fused domain protein n=3 Tax=Pseudomonas aeruginosa group TaxID=136841 RepID=A0ABD7K8T6_PSEAI|nr:MULTISPECIES: suppressor of fused domain protein [Pseudomonas aeruginosa group]KFF36672.1 hypothetical protein G039_0301290 [Pseudomonas aeruginosa VRFPA01]VTS57566.1 Suppressor of fused protein (SUFU) [Streptococcus dysgalactiae subsp. equisimilis]ABR82957.1 hypothetical protein PSPA7_0336 [Pseudomonas aeruginosa PA7]AVK03612.1 suppressor of fused family protein [Pseudomonas paraeruginosa]AVR65683.1 hypothetical protein B7D75_01270 [Pseudomonas paraeruginosa]